MDKHIFMSYFKTLIDRQVTVELKNDLCIRGTLVLVDQFLNVKLNTIEVKHLYTICINCNFIGIKFRAPQSYEKCS